jgi:hypothetical protein
MILWAFCKLRAFKEIDGAVKELEGLFGGKSRAKIRRQTEWGT